MGIEMRKIFSIFIVLALAATTGCSLSASSGSISDSISSPSRSSSDSSSDDDSDSPAPETPQDTASYRQDVSQLTVTYIKSGGELDAFRRAIADLAKARGITNWEADADTTQAIGVGAGTAGLQEPAFDDFSKQLGGDDLTKLNGLRKGYQRTAPAPTSPASTTAPDSKMQPEAQSSSTSPST